MCALELTDSSDYASDNRAHGRGIRRRQHRTWRRRRRSACRSRDGSCAGRPSIVDRSCSVRRGAGEPRAPGTGVVYKGEGQAGRLGRVSAISQKSATYPPASAPSFLPIHRLRVCWGGRIVRHACRGKGAISIGITTLDAASRIVETCIGSRGASQRLKVVSVPTDKVW